MTKLNVLEEIRNIAAERNINVSYIKIPFKNTRSFYMINADDVRMKLIMIDDSIKGTKEEIEEIAYGLGIDQAKECLRYGRAKGTDEELTVKNLVEKLALEIQDEILNELYLGA